MYKYYWLNWGFKVFDDWIFLGYFKFLKRVMYKCYGIIYIYFK